MFVFTSISDSAPGQSGCVNNGSYSALAGQGLRDIITDFTHGARTRSTCRRSTPTQGCRQPGLHLARHRQLHRPPGQLIERLYNPAGTANDKTIIYGDINGDARADFQIELTGIKPLTVSDFIL